jgi:hypothetical protein
MWPLEKIQKTRRLLGAVRTIRFSDEVHIDLCDRFALLTVEMGLRDVAAFGFCEHKDEEFQARTKGIIEREGLQALITPPIPLKKAEASADLLVELSEVFDRVNAELDEPKTDKLLWVYLDPGARAEIEKAVSGAGVMSGLLLGYPKCCTESERVAQARTALDFREAIIAAVGKEPTAIEHALRTNLSVARPINPWDQNVIATRRSYPFVFHVACDQCLSTPQSPTGTLNTAYASLAQKIDRALHQALIDMAKMEVALAAVVDEAEARGIEPAGPAQEINDRIQSLLRDGKRIFARIVS